MCMCVCVSLSVCVCVCVCVVCAPGRACFAGTIVRVYVKQDDGIAPDEGHAVRLTGQILLAGRKDQGFSQIRPSQNPCCNAHSSTATWAPWTICLWLCGCVSIHAIRTNGLNTVWVCVCVYAKVMSGHMVGIHCVSVNGFLQGHVGTEPHSTKQERKEDT